MTETTALNCGQCISPTSHCYGPCQRLLELIALNQKLLAKLMERAPRRRQRYPAERRSIE